MKEPKAYLNIGGTIAKLTAKRFPIISTFYNKKYLEILVKYTALQERNKKQNISFVILSELPTYSFTQKEWDKVEKEVNKKVEWISICTGASDSNFVVLRKGSK